MCNVGMGSFHLSSNLRPNSGFWFLLARGALANYLFFSFFFFSFFFFRFFKFLGYWSRGANSFLKPRSTVARPNKIIAKSLKLAFMDG